MNKFIKDQLFNLWRIYRFCIDPFSLEIHLAEHCNLNCKGCNHFSPIAQPQFASVYQIETSLKILKNRNVINCFKTIYLLGGEPLLNKDINLIIETVRKYFDIKKIKIEIITNGILLNSMDLKFWEVCKRNKVKITFSKYPININYNKLLNLCKEHGVETAIFSDRNEKDSAFSEYKLTTNVENRKNSYKRNFFRCLNNYCLQLKENKIFSCAPAAYIEHLNKFANVNFEYDTKDFLDITKINKFKLYSFLLRPKPFCRYCIMTRNKIIWEKSSNNPREWLE